MSDNNTGVRFGFVVPEDTAKKFYAIWNHLRAQSIKTTMTDTFSAVIEGAYTVLPDEARNLSVINLPRKMPREPLPEEAKVEVQETNG